MNKRHICSSRHELTKSTKGTRLEVFHFHSFPLRLLLFCGKKTKRIKALHLTSHVKCAVRALYPQLRQIQHKFAPFYVVCYDSLSFYVLHFADSLWFLKHGTFKERGYNITLQSYQLYLIFFFLPLFVCCTAIKQCGRQESFLSTSRHIFY